MKRSKEIKREIEFIKETKETVGSLAFAEGKLKECLDWEAKIEKIKETIREGVERCNVLPLDWCFDRIDKICSEELCEVKE